MGEVRELTALNLSRLHILSYALVAPRAVSTPSCLLMRVTTVWGSEKLVKETQTYNYYNEIWMKRGFSISGFFYLLIEWRPWINVTSSSNNKLMTSWPTSKTLRTCCLFRHSCTVGHSRKTRNWWVLCAFFYSWENKAWILFLRTWLCIYLGSLLQAFQCLQCRAMH